MPNQLAIETSVPHASIALKVGNNLPITERFESHRKQNQLLFPALQALLKMLPEGETLDLIIIGTGPGSYSGVRIAIAAAIGIAAIHECPVVGQSSFLANAVAIDNISYLAVGDARRGAFYVSEVRQGKLPTDPLLLDRTKFDATIHASEVPVASIDHNTDWCGNLEIKASEPTADNHIRVWNNWDQYTRDKLIATPAEPTYLRAPFITKAKPGHPLLRGKVNKNKLQ